MKLNKRALLSITIVVALVGSILFVLEKKEVIDIIKNSEKADKSTSEAKTTSSTLSAQEDFSEGGFRQPGSTLRENEGYGGISDTGGNTSGTETANPISSKTGEITVYSPQSGEVIRSGDTVSGTSTLPTINYRLVDSISGMIAEGELQVVNGRFSGKLSFSTPAPEGRLDFFAVRANGAEYSNVEIPLRFQK